MTYLTTGKREVIRAEYQAQVNRWAKQAGVQAPTVRVTIRTTAGLYRHKSRVIVVPPACALSCLVHEFAHHLAGPVGHGAAFRAALVQAATLAYGDPKAYPWATEYQTVRAWAEKHGLVPGLPEPTEPRRAVIRGVLGVRRIT